MGGMFSRPSAPPPQPVPPAPAPIDYDKMAAASIRVAQNQIREEEAAVKRLYPEYIGMQMGTADQLARRLDNDYLARTRGVIGEELQAASAPNAIEAQLQRDAEAELALGRSLSPEQQREATQAARAAMAARGLGTSMAGSAAEILNRDAYATARQDQRRAFASGVNQMDLARRQRRIGLAGAYGDLDPFRQGMGPAFGLGMQTLSTTAGQAGQTFGRSLQQAGNVESFNLNMLAGNRNSILNNNAALQGAAMQANAMRDAGMMGMFGQIGSSIFSDKRMKTDIKPVGKTGDVLGLTAYQFRYKDDEDKTMRVGFMAQDVQKVLPEAVQEVTVMDAKGKKKKRLTIKPAVIGAALTEALLKESEDDDDEMEMDD